MIVLDVYEYMRLKLISGVNFETLHPNIVSMAVPDYQVYAERQFEGFSLYMGMCMSTCLRMCLCKRMYNHASNSLPCMRTYIL